MDFKPSLINLRKFMKISIGANLFEGPWGGGNLFVKNLSEYLLSNGHEVVFDLFSKANVRNGHYQKFIKRF